MEEGKEEEGEATIYPAHNSAAVQSILHSSLGPSCGTLLSLSLSLSLFFLFFFFFQLVLISLSCISFSGCVWVCILFLLYKWNGEKEGDRKTERQRQTERDRGWVNSPPLPSWIWWIYSVDGDDLPWWRHIDDQIVYFAHVYTATVDST